MHRGFMLTDAFVPNNQERRTVSTFSLFGPKEVLRPEKRILETHRAPN